MTDRTTAELLAELELQKALREQDKALLEQETARRVMAEDTAQKEKERAEKEKERADALEQEKLVDAAEFLSLPLDKPTSADTFDEDKIAPAIFEVEQPTEREPTSSKRSKKSTSISGRTRFTHVMPIRVEKWGSLREAANSFRESVRGRIVKRPNEQEINGEDFAEEKAFVRFWGNPRDATRQLLAELFPESKLPNSRATGDKFGLPFWPDEYFYVKEGDTKLKRPVFTLEHKHPDLDLETGTHIADLVNEPEPTTRKEPKKFTLCTLVQTFTYMALKHLKYGAFSNWNKWIFMRREIDVEGNEVLYVSDWIDRTEARLYWATVVVRACEELDGREQQETGNLGLVPDWIRTKSKSNRVDGGPGAATHESATGASGASSGGQVESFEEISTLDALGITAVSMLTPIEVLADSTKAHTRRVQVNGRDLVAKLVDYLGVPKHSEYSAEDLYDLEQNEIRAYRHLKDVQGDLIPTFVYHGNDINQIWASAVTTYEGVSLAHTVITPEIYSSACAALKRLHGLGVLHGDCALRNAVWNGRVMLVDFENAEFRENLEDFDIRAQEEYTEFEKLLAARRVSPSTEPEKRPVSPRQPKRTKIFCCPPCT